MHIIIGIITAIAGLVWALNSLQNSGFDLNSLNPFTWARRRKWEKLYGTKAIHNLTSPLEAAAILIVGLVREEGEISKEQKETIIAIFEEKFHLKRNQSIDVFGSAVFMLKDEINFDQSVKKVLEPCKSEFTPQQTESLVSILERISTLEGSPTDSQQRIIKAVRQELSPSSDDRSTWG